ncbi:MAG: hypothetical protein RL199_1285 [Pseudomonadota bacterium]|jgi:apolipoprotein D and lipocalin family protein
MKGTLTLLLGAMTVAGCQTTTTARRQLPPVQTVAHVEVERYLGTWHEIARFPHRFQNGCTGTTATYAMRSDGDIDVVNSCRLGRLDGREKRARGWARVVDRRSNAKLEVSFFRPFWGAYWVIDLAPDYSYAVVGHPGRDYLWILSRTPTMDGPTYDAILARLRLQGYEVGRLMKAQPPGGP